MIDVLGQQFVENLEDSIQKVPGSYIWHDIRGTLEVDGQLGTITIGRSARTCRRRRLLYDDAGI